MVTQATHIPVPMHIPNIQSSSDALSFRDIPVNAQITAKPMNKQYYYRNGQPARIISTTNANKYYPILSQDPDGCRHTHTATGKFNYYRTGDQDYDILDYPTAAAPVPLPPPPFDPTRPCRYHNGETPRILCTDRPLEDRPICSMSPVGDIYCHDSTGRCSLDPSHDLQNNPRPIAFTAWANVLLGVSGLPYLVTFSTREAADKSPTTNCRLACIPVPVDCVEGQGLS